MSYRLVILYLYLRALTARALTCLAERIGGVNCPCDMCHGHREHVAHVATLDEVHARRHT